GDVSYPVGDFARRHRAVFRRGEVATVDAAARRVKLTDGRVLSYDYLLLATGVVASHFGIKGAAENTFALYTRRDAIVLRDRIMGGIERLTDSDDDFHVTVIGGGATGVELAGTLSELRREVFRATFPDLDPARLKVRLVEMAPALLMPYQPKLRNYTLAQLRKRSVDVMLETAIEEVAPDHVVLKDGRTLPSHLTVWAAGVAASEAVAGWGLPQGQHGRIVVGADLRVRDQERIFAVGDIAVNPDDPAPQLAQPALQMGRHAARQIVRIERGLPAEPFRYHDKGIMATIGRRSAVVQLRHGARFRGTIAWVAWLALHLMYLLGNRNRITTLINLSWRYLSWGRGGGVIVGDPPEKSAG
ncbi:MAG TPA: NAD(P)/FAD-dependent oxidoreductase, partial [Streptosporangiaceae bacterium]|nr:NAD(P)/FAD-dependent oxidoreductase [Streptosporangiaceae bacterium]